MKPSDINVYESIRWWEMNNEWLTSKIIANKILK